MNMVLEQQGYEKLWKGNFYKGADTLREQLKHEEMAEMITGSLSAMNVIFEDMDDAGKEHMLLPDIFFGSEYGVGKGISTYARLGNLHLESLNTFDEIVDSEEAMNNIVNSEEAMGRIVNSEVAMSKIVNIPIAMSIFVNSPVLFNAIVKSQVASNIVRGTIQSYREQILKTVENTTYFQNHGNVNITGESDLDTDYILIPYYVSDSDKETNFWIYYGANLSKYIAYINTSRSTNDITSGVSLRGIKVTPSGSDTDGYIKCYRYQAI